MRFNDKELASLSEKPAQIEAVLHHMKPTDKEWSDWYPQASFKERYFKLISNLLFYYRINYLQEPLGVLVLENAHIAYEKPSSRGIPFAFSITFKVNDKLRDNDGKHLFSCRCEADVNKWVSALKVASYDYWRTQLIILKTKLSMKTGQDPVLDYMKNKSNLPPSQRCVEGKKGKNKEPKKATFHSHVEKSEFYQSYSKTTKVITEKTVVVENLIDL